MDRIETLEGAMFLAYQALYRVWRPQQFIDVVGQEHVTKTLQNALLQQKISHAYLFLNPAMNVLLVRELRMERYLMCLNLTQLPTQESKKCGMF
jgi:hypothetical protein